MAKQEKNGLPLLRVEDLRVAFHTREGIAHAVDGVSWCLEKGHTLGIAGESGSGKSVSQYALLGLLPVPPARIESGTALFQGRDLLRASPAELRRIRGSRITMIFQDPMTALNPCMKIGKQIMEPLRIHARVSRREARLRALEMLAAAGIQDGARRLNQYPHEFSGGMRQRVMIAMALITAPDLLIADEPTTALDVTVQAQILELIQEFQDRMGMAVTLITHDLGVIAAVCRHVLIMYAGRILESAATRDLYRNPRHPYTMALMQSMPALHGRGGDLYTIPGLPPDLMSEIPGCPFAPRCVHVIGECRTAPCRLTTVAPDHQSACLRVRRGEL
jgi:oligopeptide transport system ATP-binding protein